MAYTGQSADMKRLDEQLAAASPSRQQVEMDTCWGVPIAAAASAFLLVMASSCYGYFYVLFMETYAVNHEQAAWPSSALVIAGSCTGLVVSQIQYKVSVYHITLAGGFLASIGLVASAFAPSIIWMTVTFGVLHGAGIGTALLGLSLYMLTYFDKYSGTAFAFMWTLRATVGMAGMPFLSHLTATYGLEGCLLITGGLMLHVLPFVMLIKSPQPLYLPFKIFQNTRSGPSFNSFQQLAHSVKPSPSLYSEKIAKNAVVDALASFKNICFYPLVFYSIASDYIFVTFTATVVAYARDKGCKLDIAKEIVIYNAVGLLVGRAVVPFACDKIRHSRCPMVVASFLAASACLLSMTHVPTFIGLATLASLMGMAQGYILCIKSVIISDYMGANGLSFCAGLGGLLSVPLWLSGPRIIGFFRDAKGSYDQLYLMLAALSVLTGVQLAFIAWWDKRKRTKVREQPHDFPYTSEMEPMKTSINA